MSSLDILAEAGDPGLDGWALRLVPMGTVPVPTGKLSISDPLQSEVPRSQSAPADSHAVHAVMLEPAGRPELGRVAAVLVEFAPGRPESWELVATLELGELICLADADARYRVEEWAEDGKYSQSFLEDMVEPAMLYRGRWRPHAKVEIDGLRMLLALNGNGPGRYRLYRGAAGGAELCLLLDLELLA
ncbi:MAG TPA: hypothetical protein PKW90_15500 [Myxococcota bacterium]|nr:hypothetical protein [Myxococcota bacterium]